MRLKAAVPAMIVLAAAVMAVGMASAADGLAPLVPREQVVHRAWGVDWPENAMVSIRKCWQSGMVPEVDARISADGVVFALHDLNGRYDLTNICWREIKDLDVGSAKGAQWAGEHPAKWDDILAEMAGRPERRVLLDIKDTSPAKMAALAEKYGVARQLVCLSCSASVLRAWKKAVPGAETRWVAHPGIWARRFLAGEQAARMEARVKGELDRMEAEGFAGADVVKFVVRMDPSRPDPFCPGREFLKAAFARVHAAGRKVGVWVWTAGDKVESYRLLRDLGVDNFGTDYPETLLRFLSERR